MYITYIIYIHSTLSHHKNVCILCYTIFYSTSPYYKITHQRILNNCKMIQGNLGSLSNAKVSCLTGYTTTYYPVHYLGEWRAPSKYSNTMLDNLGDPWTTPGSGMPMTTKTMCVDSSSTSVCRALHMAFIIFSPVPQHCV